MTLGEDEKVRVRRNIIEDVEEEIDKDAHIISDSTGMPTWSVFLLFAIIILLIIGLLAFCFYRLFAKKRAKKDQKQKEELDEQAILDAMEEEPDDTELKVISSNLTRIFSITSFARVQRRNTWASSSTSSSTTSTPRPWRSPSSRPWSSPPWTWGASRILTSRLVCSEISIATSYV